MTGDLFDYVDEEEKLMEMPLAVRMRPRSLDDILGQEKVLGPGKPLRRAIESDKLQSLIIFGPPGSGKTTLAQVIANITKCKFISMNAVMATVKDIRDVVDKAKEYKRLYGRRTILFLDEIHRFNKAQQDALLPFVEERLLTLIGATTQNPFFTVNGAILSRSVIIRLEKLSAEAIRSLIEKAVTDETFGLGKMRLRIDDDTVDYIARISNGDARVALNALEFAASVAEADEDGSRVIDRSLIDLVVQTKPMNYDADGDQHYDHASALIKSIRGSDVQASLYWLARMLKGGEDLGFITRRLLILAAEDIGLADPNALILASSAAAAVERVGLPEANLILSELVIYLATAPKSNSACIAIFEAMKAVEETAAYGVPKHLKDSHYKGSVRLGAGEGYKYPHDYPGHWVEQSYLPDQLKGLRFYTPGKQGYEAGIRLRDEKSDSKDRK